MACNSCSKSFSLLRPEKGCQNCGFSFCSKCLGHKIFSQKTNSEIKVCLKCSQVSNNNKPKTFEPPDAYYKRMGALDPTLKNSEVYENNIEKEISERLKKLKEDRLDVVKTSHEEINERLKELKGEVPSTSDAELATRLANLKGVPVNAIQSKAVVLKPDLRTEQEQADELMKQYMEQANIDTKYKDEFDGLVNNIETRLQNLKGTNSSKEQEQTHNDEVHLENEEELVKKIIEQAKRKAMLEEGETYESTTDELPFCEICNEDARMRCLGCKYLFCKRCFNEHKDDDDGCDRYESYTPPKNI